MVVLLPAFIAYDACPVSQRFELGPTSRDEGGRVEEGATMTYYKASSEDESEERLLINQQQDCLFIRACL